MNIAAIKLALVILISFLLNTPLGLWRVRTKRFSIQWLAAIHLAVPLIFLLRVGMNLSYAVIPILVVAAILGQLTGGILSKKKRRIYFLLIKPRSRMRR